MSNARDSRTSGLYAETIVLTIAATASVILRFVSRRISSAPFWWDDWTILLSLIFNYALSTLIWIQLGIFGLGRHTPTVSLAKTEGFFKVLMVRSTLDMKLLTSLQTFFILQILYFFNSAATKASLLLLYYRLFGIVRNFRIALVIAGTIVACYFIACLTVAIFECHPVSFFWNKALVGGACIDQDAFFRWNGVANLLTDAMILCLTLPIVWGLKIGLKQKLLLSTIFLLGTFVCVASLVRVTTFDQFTLTDPLYTIAPASLWTSVEQSLGIVCACLPMLQPLFGYLFGTKTGNITRGSRSKATELSNLSSRAPQRQSLDNSTTGFTRLHEDGLAGGSVITNATQASESYLAPTQPGILKTQSVHQFYEE